MCLPAPTEIPWGCPAGRKLWQIMKDKLKFLNQIFQAASHLSSMVFVIWIFLQFILMPFMSGIIQFTLVIFIVSSRLFKIVTDTVGFHVAERPA